MRTIMMLLVLSLFASSSCDDIENQHKRARQLAKDYCSCFESLEGTVPPALMKMYEISFYDSSKLDTLVKEMSDDDLISHRKLIAKIQDKNTPLGSRLAYLDVERIGDVPLNIDKDPVFFEFEMAKIPRCSLGLAYATKGIERTTNAIRRNQ